MTGKQLPPDTGREISALKRRVSDLERMLDRLRRSASIKPATVFDTPYAALSNTGDAETVTDGTLTVLEPVDAPVLDPTGHIFVDPAGWFVIRIAGYYELGGTVSFYDDGDAGYRSVSIVGDGAGGSVLPVVRVDRSPTSPTVLSGSRIVYAAAGPLRWHLAVEHGAGVDLAVRPDSYWVRFVTTGDPPPLSGGG